jgi:uncharacterized protein YprB with RNaseH-like and TPR domain
MLRSTFCCFKGVSQSAEQRLWKAECLTWDEFKKIPRPIFSLRKHLDVCRQIDEAEIALKAGLADYFLNRLEGAHKVRVYPDFREVIGYLDIETTGLALTDRITTLAFYNGKNLQTFVREINLSSFLLELSHVGLLVTFYGSRFDLPRIRENFNIDLFIPHLDLYQVMHFMGVRGGLKESERVLRVQRKRYVDFDGKTASKLWQKYYDEGDKESLKKLVLYNCEDALCLERLLTKAYNHSVSSFPISRQRPIPKQPRVDETLILKQFFDN